MLYGGPISIFRPTLSPQRYVYKNKNMIPMKSIFHFILLLFILTVWSCDNNETPQPRQSIDLDCGDHQDVCELNAATAQFGLSLMQRLHQDEPDENIIISPVSIATALSMTTNGARNATYEEMMKTMKVDTWPQEKLNAAYQDFLTTVPAIDPNVALNIANSIWYKEGYPVKPEFIETNQTFYDSEVRALDFSQPTAKDEINNWVDDKTEGLIDKIIEQVPDNIVMYLINAVYFKGAWLKPFDPDMTDDRPFNLANGSQVTVDMMNHGQTTLPYLATDDFQAVDLAYGDSVFSMTVILPNEGVSMDNIINGFDDAFWQDRQWTFDTTEMFFAMPKFKLEYEKTLNDALADLGMPSAFIGGVADFRNIADAELSIDEVKHKTFIEVNEEGTEAAAVTSIGIVETSVPQIPYVILDRPFLLVIRENRLSSVLFVGKVMNPVAE
jgi:serine protease inhibitor